MSWVGDVSAWRGLLSVVLASSLMLVACADELPEGSGTLTCDEGFVVVGGTCRPVQTNNPNNNNNGSNNPDDNNASNNRYDVEPYSCDYDSAGATWTPAAGDSCDLLAQGCDAPSSCLLTEEGAACIPAGDAGCGDTCDGPTDCSPGLICAGSPRRCLVPCDLGTICPGDSQCAPLTARPSLGVCAWPESPRRCDPLGDDCAADEACYLVEDRLQCVRPAAETGEVGDRCDFANACEPGLLCAGPSNAPRCATPCEVGAEDACAAGTCTPLRGYEAVGVCL